MNMELVTDHYAHYVQNIMYIMFKTLCTLCSTFNMYIMLYFSVDLDRFIHYCASLYVKYLEQRIS